MKTKTTIQVSTALLVLLCLFLSIGCKQSGELLVSPDGNVPIKSGGETKSITVTASSGWGVSVTDNDGEWLGYDKPNNKVLSLIAGANTGFDTRTATVKIFLDDNSASKTLMVVQKGQPQTITVAPESLLFIPKEGTVRTVNVSCSEPVDLKITDELDWVDLGTVGPDGTLEITIKENTAATGRSGSIGFSDANGNASSVTLTISQAGEGTAVDPILQRGYTLMSSMQPAPALTGLGYTDEVWRSVHSDMQIYGWDYSEHPNSSANDHNTEAHVAVEWDEEIGQYVYRFTAHCHPGAVDGDRGSKKDRMRNEMKSRTSRDWYKMNGNYDEWQVLTWKMKIPTGWQPTSSFCHIHQLKAQEGSDNGSPIITISLRADGNGSNRRLEVIHTARSKDYGGVSKGKIVDSKTQYSLDKFEGEWLQVEQEAHYRKNGYYKIKISKVVSGEVLLDAEVNDIDLWRTAGCVNVRNKFGIYRNYNLSGDYVEGGQLPNLKDESIFLADFKVYEKNSNNNGTAVND